MIWYQLCDCWKVLKLQVLETLSLVAAHIVMKLMYAVDYKI